MSQWDFPRSSYAFDTPRMNFLQERFRTERNTQLTAAFGKDPMLLHRYSGPGIPGIPILKPLPEPVPTMGKRQSNSATTTSFSASLGPAASPSKQMLRSHATTSQAGFRKYSPEEIRLFAPSKHSNGVDKATCGPGFAKPSDNTTSYRELVFQNWNLSRGR